MEIRRAKIEDVAELNRLLTLLIHDEKKYNVNINVCFEVTNMYENYIDDKEKCILVAEENHEIIGYLYGYKKKMDSSILFLEVSLDALYVIENKRNCGVAHALIAAFKIWAKEQGAKYIDVMVWNANSEAKNLYFKQDFLSQMELLRYTFHD